MCRGFLPIFPLPNHCAQHLEGLPDGLVAGVQGLQPAAAVFVFEDFECHLIAADQAGHDAVTVHWGATLGVHKNKAAFGVGAHIARWGCHAVSAHAQYECAFAMWHWAIKPAFYF